MRSSCIPSWPSENICHFSGQIFYITSLLGFINIAYYSGDCAIPDPITDTVVVTGGGYTYHTVVRYGQQGWLEDLPDLISGRNEHACSSFMSSGRLVSNMYDHEGKLLSRFQMCEFEFKHEYVSNCEIENCHHLKSAIIRG